MKAYTPHQRPGGRRRCAGFTLVELLVVIAIITLLVGIMVPTVSAVKDIAKAGATKALLHSISTGLDMFRNEAKLGGQYPPSFWHTATQGSPYSSSEQDWDADGAQTLVWGLAGADLLGTPGFDTSQHPMSNGPNGLYEISGGKHVQASYGPFMDISKTTIKKPTRNDVDRCYNAQNNGEATDGMVAPVVVDNFNMPVLYFVPDLSTGAYRRTDNDMFLVLADPLYNKFGAYINDPRVSAAQRSYNYDSYLLITAGPDRLYGTRDDVCNFPQTPQN